MMRLLIAIICIAISFPHIALSADARPKGAMASGEDGENTYERALTEYRAGRFEEAARLLHGKLQKDAGDYNLLGWAIFKLKDLDNASRQFRMSLATDPSMHNSYCGLGYIYLQRGLFSEAKGYFDKGTPVETRDVDCILGKGLILEKLNDTEEAIETFKRVLDIESDNRLAQDRLVILSSLPPDQEAHPEPKERPDAIVLPMRVSGQTLELAGQDGSYRPIFVKAINLGAALPGKFPSEFPVDRDTYRDWFTRMRECGFTAVRVYTIFPPVFYDTLAYFNANRQDPLYLIHGVWTELPADNNFADPDFIEDFRAEIRRVVDLLHGALDLPVRRGHASGRYRSDVSKWWIATILGREWEPYSVIAYNEMRPGARDYKGRFIKAFNASAMELWLAEQMEYAISYETSRWNTQRPIAWTNWPTLDPLFHPTETTKSEENEWRKRLGVPLVGIPSEESGIHEYERENEDIVSLDMEKFESTDENHGGIFTVYHAYPYYPDFMIYDPTYLATYDIEGSNAYLGYLRDLMSHHKKHPLFIAEFGVPTSREIAHIQPQGWAHGGHSERLQGEIDARLFRTIYQSGAAGGSLFAWIDEWFKHNWLVMGFHRPPERNPLWHDRQDAEQNYGLIAYRAGSMDNAIIIDGKDKDWNESDVILRAAHGSPGIISSLSVKSNESDIFLLLRADFSGRKTAFAVVIDVVDPSLGGFRFPAGLDLKSSTGFEAALLFDGESAQIVIDETYDRWKSRYRPMANERGIYVSPKTEPNRMRITRNGTIIPATVLEIGWLRRGTTDRNSPEFDDRAEWELDAAAGIAEFRIPWGILNVTDPSSRAVLFKGEEYPGGYRITEGFHFAVAAFTPADTGAIWSKDGNALDVLPQPDPDGIVFNLPLYRWETWDAPRYHSFEKLSYNIIKEALQDIPDSPVTGKVEKTIW